MRFKGDNDEDGNFDDEEDGNFDDEECEEVEDEKPRSVRTLECPDSKVLLINLGRTSGGPAVDSHVCHPSGAAPPATPVREGVGGKFHNAGGPRDRHSLSCGSK